MPTSCEGVPAFNCPRPQRRAFAINQDLGGEHIAYHAMAASSCRAATMLLHSSPMTRPPAEGFRRCLSTPTLRINP